MLKAFALGIASLLALGVSADAWGQQSTAAPGGDPRKSYDFGVQAGSLLPSRIAGISEIVPGWAMRASAPSSKGVFEASLYLGRGQGIQYNTTSIDYRLDIASELIRAHAILGLHADFFSSEARPSTFSGGWHYGGGITEPIAGRLLFRADFQHRFSPGQSVLILLGFVYRMPAEGGDGGG